jgi:hypothetical protein
MITSDWRATARRPLAAVCVTVIAMAILSACGGSGGSTPAATLAIDAGASSTSSAGASIALHARQSHSTSIPAWSLSGPGSLSATTGTDVTYTPPDGESLTQAGTATITVSADGLSRQIAIPVAVGSVAGQHWETTRALAPEWKAVAFGSGAFVAVGSSGCISVSTDGRQWTPHNTAGHYWLSVVHGDAGWVAVSSDGSVGTSADGATWSVSASALPGAEASTNVTQVIFANGIYLVGSHGSGSWISSDGATWTAIPHSFASIAAGGGVIVGIESGGGTFASTDGRQWDAVYPGFIVSAVAYANGRFLAISASSLVGSADGRSWGYSAYTPYSSDPVFSAADTFYQAGSDTYQFNSNVFAPAAIGTSTDGVQWTYHNQSALGLASGFAVGSNTLVAVSRDGSIGSGPDVDHLQAAMPRSSGYLLSGDYVHGKYMALSSSGDLLQSADGHTWSDTVIALAAWPDASTSFHGFAMAHAASGRIVVSGYLGSNTNPTAVLYSDDGVAWHVATVPEGMPEATIINDGTRFLAFANGDVYASDDGSVWSHAASFPVQAGQWAARAVFAQGRYVVVGYGGLVATSPDATHWTVQPIPAAPGQATAPFDFLGIVHAGNRFVAVGANGNVAISADGTSWSTAASATPQLLYAIAASPQGELVAVGDLGVIETSVDALHWTVRGNSDPASLHDIVFGNGAFMAIGADDFIGVSTH